MCPSLRDATRMRSLRFVPYIVWRIFIQNWYQPNILTNRMKSAYQRVKQAKIWEDPNKAKVLEKLLGQIEALLE